MFVFHFSLYLNNSLTMYSMDIADFPGDKIPDFISIGSVTVLPNTVGYDVFVQFSCNKLRILSQFYNFSSF